MKQYPIPNTVWMNKVACFSENFISTASRLGLVQKDSCVQMAGRENSEIWDTSHHKINEELIREKMFPVLLILLHVTWFDLERPRAATEDLVLDFKDVSSVHIFDGALLSLVAGVAESSYETGKSRLISSIRFHNCLFPYVNACLEQLPHKIE